MDLLLSDKEITRFLIYVLRKELFFPETYEYAQTKTEENIMFTQQEIQHPRFNLNKKRKKIKERIVKTVEDDLRDYLETFKFTVRNKKQKIFPLIQNNLDLLLSKLGEDRVLEQYGRSSFVDFVKGAGLSISSDARLVRRKAYQNTNSSIVLRNTTGNEHILADRIKNLRNFWFIDSGYTNFIEPNKKWHRLVKDHLHYSGSFDTPADRLSIFPTFPRPWKKEGKKILIIEPGVFAAWIFGIDIALWKQNLIDQLQRYTDRPIEFREKINKKARKPLFQELLEGDYYCTVSLNSNSAIESIWAGVPAITLERHISNPVTVNNLSEINDLKRPNLGDWLCVLSYNQFTYEELVDGRAYQIIKKYHG